MYNSVYFISPEVIWADLTRYITTKEISVYDVVELCAQVETRYIQDIDLMTNIYEVPLTVINSQALLPCNIFKILDIYDGYETPIDFSLSATGAYLTGLKYQNSGSNYTDDTVYINYKGTNLDPETGYPLIAKGHENACETFCKIRLFEEDALFGKINMSMYANYQQQFSGQISNALQNPYRQQVANYLKNIETIRGNMIPQIGRLELSHKKFRSNNGLISPTLDK